MILELLALGLLITTSIRSILHSNRVEKLEADLKDLRLKAGNEFLKIGRNEKGNGILNAFRKDGYTILRDIEGNEIAKWITHKAEDTISSAKDDFRAMMKDIDETPSRVDNEVKEVKKELSAEDSKIVEGIANEDKVSER